MTSRDGRVLTTHPAPNINIKMYVKLMSKFPPACSVAEVFCLLLNKFVTGLLSPPSASAYRGGGINLASVLSTLAVPRVQPVLDFVSCVHLPGTAQCTLFYKNC